MNNCRICLQPFQGFPMGEKNGYKLAACKSCGSVVPEPWPTQADLDKFFGDVQPEIVHLPDPAAEIGRLKKIIMKVAGPAAGRSFLDVSCRQGYSVIAAKSIGFQARGIDPHDFFVEFAKDRHDTTLFEHVSVPDFADRGEQADVVFSIESFCEQPDPEGYMAALAKILTRDGMAYIQEPDGNSFHLPKNFTSWIFVDPPLNFTYLSKKGMEALLDRHGLKIRKSLFTWAPFMRLIVVKK